MIDANSFNDALVEFHNKFYDEFPYKFEGIDKKSYVKNFMDWSCEVLK